MRIELFEELASISKMLTRMKQARKVIWSQDFFGFHCASKSLKYYLFFELLKNETNQIKTPITRTVANAKMSIKNVSWLGGFNCPNLNLKTRSNPPKANRNNIILTIAQIIPHFFSK